MDYGMCLDVPTQTLRNKHLLDKHGISTIEQAVSATHINNEYFINNRTGECKLLNVLQGLTHSQSDDWYDEMKKYNNGKQLKDFWDLNDTNVVFESGTTPKREKTYGKHPTQKPISLLERIIEASTTEGQIILDPFAGSATTLFVANSLNRFAIGIELDKIYLDLGKKRIIGGIIYGK
jgi:hypothetical protein